MTELLKQSILSLIIHTGFVIRLYVMLTHYCLCGMTITSIQLFKTCLVVINLNITFVKIHSKKITKIVLKCKTPENYFNNEFLLAVT